MKVIIFIFGEGEYSQDTLESRMVDVRVEDMQKEFIFNGIYTEVVKTDGGFTLWDDNKMEARKNKIKESLKK